MNIRLDKALEQDSPTLLGMMEAFNAEDNYPFEPEKCRETLIEFICSPGFGRLFIIRNQDREAVGYIILTLSYSFEYGGKNAVIDEFYIEEEYKGMGIGQLALDFIEVEARELGVNALHLEVHIPVQGSEPLYLKQGFVGNNRSLMTKKLA